MGREWNKKKSLNITLNGHILGHISEPPCWPKDNMNGNGVSIQVIYRGNNQKRFKKEENEKEKKGQSNITVDPRGFL